MRQQTSSFRTTSSNSIESSMESQSQTIVFRSKCQAFCSDDTMYLIITGIRVFNQNKQRPSG